MSILREGMKKPFDTGSDDEMYDNQPFYCVVGNFHNIGLTLTPARMSYHEGIFMTVLKDVIDQAYSDSDYDIPEIDFKSNGVAAFTIPLEQEHLMDQIEKELTIEHHQYDIEYSPLAVAKYDTRSDQDIGIGQFKRIYADLTNDSMTNRPLQH